MYFDFHTHLSNKKNSLYNYRVGKQPILINDAPPFSAGIHPWDLNKINLGKAYKELRDLAVCNKCLAIGELGLDKKIGTDLDLQIDVLREQIQIASSCQQKVLIIHCVRAYQEIIFEKKNSNDDLIWVLHAFKGSKELIESLLKHDFYFSLGVDLLNEDSKISRNIVHIPLNRLLLETDDSSVEIEDVYLAAAKLKGIEIGKLQDQIAKNVEKLIEYNSFK